MIGVDRCGVLLAAHGERGGVADNASVVRLAAELSRRQPAVEIGFGFINGTPSISDAVKAFTAREIIVYPLFFSDGYFTRMRLPQLLLDAGRPDGKCSVRILSPLGLDPSFATLVAARAAQASGCANRQVSMVLLAHGSQKDAASRRVTERLAEQLRGRIQFFAVSCAYLEEAPHLEDAIKHVQGPAVVVGLFVGEGLHGAEDVPRSIRALNRPDVSFAGNAGAWSPEIADVVTEAIKLAHAKCKREHERNRKAG